jgi:hypothetical protein
MFVDDIVHLAKVFVRICILRKSCKVLRCSMRLASLYVTDSLL